MKLATMLQLLRRPSRTRHQQHQAGKRVTRRRPLEVELLERRELLAAQAPSILSVSPVVGSTNTPFQPATLKVHFSEDMAAFNQAAPQDALNPGNYELFGAGGTSFSVDTVAYD